MYLYRIEHSAKNILKTLKSLVEKKNDSSDFSLDNQTIVHHQKLIKELMERTIQLISDHFGEVKLLDEKSILAYLNLIDNISILETHSILSYEKVKNYLKMYQILGRVPKVSTKVKYLPSLMRLKTFQQSYHSA